MAKTTDAIEPKTDLAEAFIPAMKWKTAATIATSILLLGSGIASYNFLDKRFDELKGSFKELQIQNREDIKEISSEIRELSDRTSKLEGRHNDNQQNSNNNPVELKKSE